MIFSGQSLQPLTVPRLNTFRQLMGLGLATGIDQSHCVAARHPEFHPHDRSIRLMCDFIPLSTILHLCFEKEVSLWCLPPVHCCHLPPSPYPRLIWPAPPPQDSSSSSHTSYPWQPMNNSIAGRPVCQYHPPLARTRTTTYLWHWLQEAMPAKK